MVPGRGPVTRRSLFIPVLRNSSGFRSETTSHLLLLLLLVVLVVVGTLPVAAKPATVAFVNDGDDHSPSPVPNHRERCCAGPCHWLPLVGLLVIVLSWVVSRLRDRGC